MTSRARAVGIVLTVVVLAGGVALVAHGRRHHQRPAVATAAASAATSAPATFPPTTDTATPVGPATSTTSPATPPPTTPDGAWQAVSQVRGLDVLVTSTGAVVRVDPRALDVALVP